MVFTAEILSIDPASGGEFRLALRPLTVFKGSPSAGIEVFTAQHGCTEFDLDFHIDGVIAGRLVFPKGVAPSECEVEATPADDPDVFPASSWTDQTGRFVLHGLKPGRYIVVFRKTEKRKVPNLQADLFAPGTPNRANAKVIELGKAAHVEGVEFVIPRTALK